jgi:hypothetical protein
LAALLVQLEFSEEKRHGRLPKGSEFRLLSPRKAQW